MEPGSSFYNIPAAVRLRGVLNIEALERTLSEVVRRHEGLRTHFISIDGEPVQVIEPPREVRLAITDLSGLDEAERTAETERLVQEERAIPFDLMRGPLLRMSLLPQWAYQALTGLKRALRPPPPAPAPLPPEPSATAPASRAYP